MALFRRCRPFLPRQRGTNVTTHQRVVHAGRLVLGVQPQPAAPTGVGGGTIAVNGFYAAGGGGGEIWQRRL